MILIISSKLDGHIEAVSRHLDLAGEKWVRLNTEDLATNAQITIRPETGSGSMFLRDSGKEVALEEVRSVWFRKPEAVNLGHLSLDEASRDYVEAEFNEILHGIYGLLGRAYWINDPFSTRISHRKMVQLQVAKSLGFTVPHTVITNDASTALRFSEEVGGDVAIKSLGAISVTQESGTSVTQYGIFTRRVSSVELAEFQDKVRFLPTQFQQFIQKVYELRITCVGGKVFACRIEPRAGELTEEDCRFDISNLVHKPCECPELHERLRAYMEAFRLNFACFDIGVTKTGQAIFFECNPNGQWLWVENLTGLEIGRAIADELVSREMHGR